MTTQAYSNETRFIVNARGEVLDRAPLFGALMKEKAARDYAMRRAAKCGGTLYDTPGAIVHGVHPHE